MTALFGQFNVRVFGYARRYVDRDAAEEVTSETFLIAWRRLEEIPDDALPWLLVVARNLIANQQRKWVRRQRLADEMLALQRVTPMSAPADQPLVERSELLRALGTLSSAEREALLLTGWDGLNDTQAAQVCGCSARAFRVRLHRARKRLERGLDDSGEQCRVATSARSMEPLLEGSL